jgi:hypothetical protein
VQRLLLSVRAGMPNNPYHNWIHIVDVTQVIRKYDMMLTNHSAMATVISPHSL